MSSLLIVLAFFLWEDDAKAPYIPSCPHSHGPSCRSDDGGICIRRFADVLPKELFEELKDAAKRPPEATKWIARDALPRNTFERVARKVANVLGLAPADYSSVEYWVKSGLPEDNWHFDSHEEFDDCAALPYMSSIVYLDDFGPPTLILSKTLYDERFDDPKGGPANDTTYLSWPSTNHLLSFSGDLYHGVHMSKFVAKSTRKRGIVLFNFWRHGLSDPPPDEQCSASSENPACGSFEAVGGARSDSLAAAVPLHMLGEASGKDFLSRGEEDFANPLVFEITYRLHHNEGFIEGCKFDKGTWKRDCVAGAESPLVAVASSLKKVRMLAPRGFTGNLTARRD